MLTSEYCSNPSIFLHLTHVAAAVALLSNFRLGEGGYEVRLLAAHCDGEHIIALDGDLIVLIDGLRRRCLNALHVNNLLRIYAGAEQTGYAQGEDGKDGVPDRLIHSCYDWLVWWQTGSMTVRSADARSISHSIFLVQYILPE